jgi:serine/threonine protein kinase/tetratricopeptide (TPR) repeat protein
MPGQSDPPPKGPTKLGQYVLLRELGRGAIGIVYAAYHEGLDRKLAIKVLNRARAGRPDLEARLRREARALARLSHSNVVQVYDVGEIDGRVFVVMEFVEGRTLGEWMREGHALDEILALFAAAGRGLAAAHAAGVVHRDFKPDNVIVGLDGRPRVLDFGLARAVAEDERPGTPEPPTPEPREPKRRAESNVECEPDAQAEPEATPDLGREVDDRTRPGPTDRLSARQFAASRDAGDPHLNVRTRDPAASDVVTAVEDPQEFEITTQSGPRERVGEEVLTRTGVRLGTPAYMSPEQFMAKPVDHRSDQFSFCVALHQAVYGRRPYPARNQADLLVQVHSGEILPAPPDSLVPIWLREIIVRGLSPKPEDRWPSMDELITAIESPPEPPTHRRWTIGLAIVGVAIVALVIGLLSPTREAKCPTPTDTSAVLWTPERARSLADAFSSSGSGYADAAWTNVEARLGTWVELWASEQAAVCEAAQATREAAPASSGTGLGDASQLLDRRSACLDRSRRAFEALVEQFQVADRAMVEHAVEAVAALPDPAHCGRLDKLTDTLAPPPAEHAVEIAELRNQLSEIDMRVATGGWDLALPLARAAVERAKRTFHGPVIAEALLTLGRLLAQSDQANHTTDEALAQLQDALDQAERSSHHELVPSIATELVSLSIYAKPDPIRGRLWARRALTGLDRLERERPDEHGEALVLLRARGIWALGNLERLDGDYEHAVLHIRDALALLDTHAPTHPDRGIMLNDLGNALADRGDVPGARRAYEQAVEASLVAFGEGHPRVGNAHFNLARLAMVDGNLEEAREQADRAFIIFFAAAHGDNRRDVGAVEILRAGIELEDKHIEAAREHARRAQGIYDAVLAPDNLDRAEPHQMLGHVAYLAEDCEQARTSYRTALAIKQAALPLGHIELVSTLTNLGLVEMELGDQALATDARELAATEFEAAAIDLEQALVLLEAADGIDPQHLRDARLFFADVLMRRGNPGDHARAAGEYEAGLRDCPIDELSCVRLAVGASEAWHRLDQLERARERAVLAKGWLAELDRLAGLDPDDPDVIKTRKRADALPE